LERNQGAAMRYLGIALHAMQDISAHGNIDAGAGFGIGHGDTTILNFIINGINNWSRNAMPIGISFYDHPMIINTRPDPDGLWYEWGDYTMTWLVRILDPTNNARIFGYDGIMHVTSDLLYRFARHVGITGISELPTPCPSFPSVPLRPSCNDEGVPPRSSSSNYRLAPGYNNSGCGCQLGNSIMPV